MLRIAIVEDEKQHQANLVEQLSQYEKDHNEQFVVRTFFDGIDILDDYTADYDVIFLDIHMKYQDGMSTAKKIRELDENVIIIFITALAQYAIEGYKVNAMDFILKPVVYEQLEIAMDKVLLTARKYQKNKQLMVLDNGGKRKVSTDDIFYIEVVAHDMFFYTKQGTFQQRGTTLKDMAEELEPFHFIKSGQSQLVNLRYVENISGDVVTLPNAEIFLSRSRKKAFITAFAEYVGMEI